MIDLLYIGRREVFVIELMCPR